MPVAGVLLGGQPPAGAGLELHVAERQRRARMRSEHGAGGDAGGELRRPARVGMDDGKTISEILRAGGWFRVISAVGRVATESR